MATAAADARVLEGWGLAGPPKGSEHSSVTHLSHSRHCSMSQQRADACTQEAHERGSSGDGECVYSVSALGEQVHADKPQHLCAALDVQMAACIQLDSA